MIFEILFLVSDWICHVTPPQTSQHSGVNLGVLYEGGGSTIQEHRNPFEAIWDANWTLEPHPLLDPTLPIRFSKHMSSSLSFISVRFGLLVLSLDWCHVGDTTLCLFLASDPHQKALNPIYTSCPIRLLHFAGPPPTYTHHLRAASHTNQGPWPCNHKGLQLSSKGCTNCLRPSTPTRPARMCVRPTSWKWARCQARHINKHYPESTMCKST